MKRLAISAFLFLSAPSWAAINFHSANTEQINLGNPASLTITNAITISAWAYTSSFDNFGCFVGKNDATATTRNYVFQIRDDMADVMQFSFTQGVGNYIYDFSNSSMQLNTWTHLVVTYDGASMKFYFNGALDKTSSVGSGAMDSTTGSAAIGISGDDLFGTSYWNGSLDDVRIYNRALSASEIQEVYKSRGRISITTGLAGQWPMDEGNPSAGYPSSMIVRDVSQYHNNGSVITGIGGTPLSSTSVINYPYHADQ